jgi:hypothetical protein
MGFSPTFLAATTVVGCCRFYVCSSHCHHHFTVSSSTNTIMDVAPFRPRTPVDTRTRLLNQLGSIQPRSPRSASFLPPHAIPKFCSVAGPCSFDCCAQEVWEGRKVDWWKTNQVAPRVPVRALDRERVGGNEETVNLRERSWAAISVLAHRYMPLRLR